MRDFIFYYGLRVVVALMCLQWIAPARAADFNWAAPVSGTFGNASKWNPAEAPGTADRAIFDLGSTGYSVGGAGTVDSLFVGNDTVQLNYGIFTATSSTLPAIAFGNASGDIANVNIQVSTVTGNNDAIGYSAGSRSITTLNTSTWSSNTQYVGYAGVGELDLDVSSVRANQEVIGLQSGAVGTINMADSSLDVADQLAGASASLIIGGSGAGTLTASSSSITLGQQLVVAQSSGSQGTFTLSGASAVLTTPSPGVGRMTGLFIGQGGTGTMTIEEGATTALAGPIGIGVDAGAHGSLTVTGTHSLLAPYGSGSSQITGVTVGGAGVGSFAVTNGATAELAGMLVIGDTSGSQGTFTIDGSGAIVKQAGSGNSAITGLIVGNAGTGSLSITEGGQFQGSAPVTIGSAPGSSGNIAVHGAGSAATLSNSRQDTIVGGGGSGELDVTGGGVVTSIGLLIGRDASAHGVVTVDGAGSVATLSTLPQSTVVGAAGTGELDIRGGGIVESSALLIGRDASSHGAVTISGAGSLLNDTDQNGGGSTFVVGQSGVGSLSITNGGAISTLFGNMIIGQNAGSSGTVSIDGAGSNVNLRYYSRPIGQYPRRPERHGRTQRHRWRNVDVRIDLCGRAGDIRLQFAAYRRLRD